MTVGLRSGRSDRGVRVTGISLKSTVTLPWTESFMQLPPHIEAEVPYRW
jgi:hypothetical protein